MKNKLAVPLLTPVSINTDPPAKGETLSTLCLAPVNQKELSSTSSDSNLELNAVNEPVPSVKNRVLTNATPSATRLPHNEEDGDEMWADESADSSSASSGDFDYEALYFQISSELNKLKKESAAREQKMKAEWAEIKTELEKKKERETELEIRNQKLVEEFNQLANEKERQRLDYTVSLANAVEDYEMALLEIQKLTSKNTALEESITIETSWKESFKTQLEANKVITDDAKSNLNIQIEQQAEKIENLERQSADSFVSENQLTELVEEGLEEERRGREEERRGREERRRRREEQRRDERS